MIKDKKKGNWIKVSRNLQTHWLWKTKPFTRGQAWIDLLLSACFSEQKDPNLHIVKEGELVVTQDVLADRWGWGRQKVRLFLNKLEVDSMIVQFTTPYGTKRTTTKQPENNQRTTREEPTLYNKNDKNEKECLIIGNITFKLSFVEEKKKLFPMLDVVGEIRKCINWKQSKGIKPKNWNMTVSNWLSIAFDRSAHTGEVKGGNEYEQYVKYRSP